MLFYFINFCKALWKSIFMNGIPCLNKDDWLIDSREPALFWRENVITIVILHRDLARMS